MKKFIAVLIAAVMAFTLVPVTAFAANGPMPPHEPGEMGPWGNACISVFDMEQDREAVVFYAGKEITDMPEGFDYDLATNTLTITDVDRPNDELSVRMMGDDFTLRVIGDCAFAVMYVNDYEYSTCVNITGTGTLTLNEKKEYLYGLSMFGGDENKHVNIEKSVTVHSYAGAGEGSAPVYAYSKRPDPAGILTEEGVPVEGFTGEENTYEDCETVDVAIKRDPDKEVYHGKRLISKDDPEGIYTENSKLSNGDVYVSRYVYIPELDVYDNDQDYSWVRLTAEQFAAQYEYATALQPARIRYFTEWGWEERGENALLLTSAGDPDELFAAINYYGDSYDIYRIHWDEAQDIYFADGNAVYRNKSKNDFDSLGFAVQTETKDEHVTIRCWAMPPGSEGNWESDYDVVSRASDPESFYVQTATYKITQGESLESQVVLEEGYVFQKVQYTDDDEPEAYVDTYDAVEGETKFSVEKSLFDSGESDFSYVMTPVTREVEIHVVPPNQKVEDYQASGDYWTKDGQDYTVIGWSYGGYADNTYYDLYPVSFDEEKGYNFRGDSIGEVDPDELPDQGYTRVMEDQPYEFVSDGTLIRRECAVYTDDEDTRYLAYKEYYDDPDYLIFTYDPDKTITFGDNEEMVYYYDLTPVEGLTVDDLHDTAYTVHTGWYRYALAGTEYTHLGDGTEPEPVYSGKTGECDWSYDPATFTLTISGNGETGGYDEENPAPWSEFTVKNVDIKDGVKHIRSCNFNNTDIESVTIPDSVEHIGMITFRDCKKLREVKLSKNLKSIAGGAFNGCSALEKIDIPDKVESIGPFAFGNCSNLAEIKVPDSLYDVGASIFENTKWYADQPDGPVYVGKAYYGYHGALPGNTVLKIKEGTVSIAAGTMSDSYPKENLAGVVFPSTITKIPAMFLFYGCKNIKEFEIPATVTEIEDKALGYWRDEEAGEMKKIEGLTIVGEKGSEAERYANDNGFIFKEKGGVLMGDANGDGNVDISDVTTVQRHAAELETLTGDRFTAGDVDRNGVINVTDATLIQKYLVEIVPEF